MMECHFINRVAPK